MGDSVEDYDLKEAVLWVAAKQSLFLFFLLEESL